MEWVRRVFSALVFATLIGWFLYLLRSMMLGDHRNVLFGARSIEVKVTHIALFAAASAAIGWVVSAQFSRANSVKQHTMSVLTQVRLSAEMSNRIRTLFLRYPAEKRIEAADLIGQTNEPWFNAATYMLNYYEFLAVARRYGDLHEKLLRDCIRSQLLNYMWKLDAVIEHSRETDMRVVSGEIVKQDSRVYKDILLLKKQWQ